MKKKFLIVLLCIAAMFAFIPPLAYGDVGPKPSVIVNFEGLQGKTYYTTLLSETSSTGPYSAVGRFEGDRRYSEDEEDYEIWNKFVDYQDEDGYYFLQYFSDCTETQEFKWTYYPPQKFKILLYFPELDSFAVSDVYERYAFASYYTVDAENMELTPLKVHEGITAEKSYNFTREIISLFLRIIATIAIEILVALLFGYRAKKQLRIILITNIATQTILNIMLNTVNYYYGGLAFLLSYILAEIVVFLIEAGVYASFLTKDGTGRLTRKSYSVLYAFVANVVSFYLGFQIARLIPGIF
ncbi:MAG TPA: hypothetical protein PLL21_04285 [Sedimentibacter sp.]|nr:hypothetical protein [Sedimentibacter sp.]HOH69196.1 hypothetical protein [Sedimentibacter sp.]HQB63580.1 hypothetical protein [Sedimentibacter sp.]